MGMQIKKEDEAEKGALLLLKEDIWPPYSCVYYTCTLSLLSVDVFHFCLNKSMRRKKLLAIAEMNR